jgi:O-antigen ligase
MRWSPGLVLTAAWVAAGTCLYVVAPFSAPVVLLLAIAAPILWCPRADAGRTLRSPSLPALMLVPVCAYLLANANWSPAPAYAYKSVVTVALAAVVLHAVARTMPLLDGKPVRAMSIGFVAGYAAAALFLCVETLSDHAILLQLYQVFPRLVPRARGMVVEGGVVEGLPESFLNHRMAALAFLIWPALWTAGRLSCSTRTRIALAACLSPAVVAIAASAHETSKVALVGGAAVVAAPATAPRRVRPMLAAAWVAACLAVVPVSSALYDLGLQRSAWLPESARHRVVIWGVTSKEIAEAPILGHGIGAARKRALESDINPTHEPGTPFRQSTGWHAHSAYLQAWYEAGAIGAALLLGIGLATLAAIARAPATAAPVLHTAFATNALIAASSFSLGATWFQASHALAAVFAMLWWRFAETAGTDAGLRGA